MKHLVSVLIQQVCDHLPEYAVRTQKTKVHCLHSPALIFQVWTLWSRWWTVVAKVWGSRPLGLLFTSRKRRSYHLPLLHRIEVKHSPRSSAFWFGSSWNRIPQNNKLTVTASIFFLQYFNPLECSGFFLYASSVTIRVRSSAFEPRSLVRALSWNRLNS
jgi:hypothetical protein